MTLNNYYIDNTSTVCSLLPAITRRRMYDRYLRTYVICIVIKISILNDLLMKLQKILICAMNMHTLFIDNNNCIVISFKQQ